MNCCFLSCRFLGSSSSQRQIILTSNEQVSRIAQVNLNNIAASSLFVLSKPPQDFSVSRSNGTKTKTQRNKAILLWDLSRLPSLHRAVRFSLILASMPCRTDDALRMDRMRVTATIWSLEDRGLYSLCVCLFAVLFDHPDGISDTAADAVRCG